MWSYEVATYPIGSKPLEEIIMARSANKRRVLIAATAAAGLTVAATVGIPMAMADETDRSQAAQCELPEEHDTDVTTEIYQVAEENGADDKVLLATFEAGWVASHMNNLDCGADTYGVFQATEGSELCATVQECLDVAAVSHNFLLLAQEVHEGNPDATAGEVAASVMRSAYPDRYDEAEPKALELIEEASQA